MISLSPDIPASCYYKDMPINLSSTTSTTPGRPSIAVIMTTTRSKGIPKLKIALSTNIAINPRTIFIMSPSSVLPNLNIMYKTRTIRIMSINSDTKEPANAIAIYSQR